MRDYSDALRDLGYGRYFEDSFSSLAEVGDLPARVIEEQRGRYRVVFQPERGALAEAEALASPGLLKGSSSATELPAVGDWVALKSPNRATRGGPLFIRRVLPRAGAFIRKTPGEAQHDRIEAQVVAANVDYAFIVAAAGADWKPRRVERYVVLARAANAQPVLVLTKADLAADPGRLLAEAAAAAPAARTALICAPSGLGLGDLSFALAPGRTTVLIGSSGAGKSTLLNALAGETLARTGEIRADDERGRHTTTSRRLYRLRQGALIIDTPGLRELQLWADEEEAGAAFPEIEELAALCRFRDCRHESEPGCAVRAALEAGELDAGRFSGWGKLTKEAAFLRAKEEGSGREAERRRWRAIERSRRSFAKTSRRDH